MPMMPDVEISPRRRREIALSKWKSLPSLFWSIVVIILSFFSIAQTTLIKDWPSLHVLGLLGGLFVLALIAAVIVGVRQKTPTEKLATATALYHEGRRRFGERDYIGAETAMERSVVLDSDEQRAWNLLGRAQLRLGKYTEAIHSFNMALKVNVQPDLRDTYLHNRAVSHLLNGDFGHA